MRSSQGPRSCLSEALDTLATTGPRWSLASSATVPTMRVPLGRGDVDGIDAPSMVRGHRVRPGLPSERRSGPPPRTVRPGPGGRVEEVRPHARAAGTIGRRHRIGGGARKRLRKSPGLEWLEGQDEISPLRRASNTAGPNGGSDQFAHVPGRVVGQTDLEDGAQKPSRRG